MAKKPKKKKAYNLKGVIINSLRNLSLKHPQRKEVEDRTKVAPATHQCSRCKVWCYKGTSDKNLKALQDEYPKENIIKGRLDVDHISPCISLEKGWKFTYDNYIKRLFCGSEGLVGLCKICHKEKSKLESQIRKHDEGTTELVEAWIIYKDFLREFIDE